MLNIPAEFSSVLVFACRTFLFWSIHVTLGLGNHLSAFALMVPSEKVKAGAV